MHCGIGEGRVGEMTVWLSRRWRMVQAAPGAVQAGEALRWYCLVADGWVRTASNVKPEAEYECQGLEAWR